MRLTCGGCGAHGSYEFFTSDAEARACFAAAQQLPGGFGPLLLEYLTLFRPRQRLLTWSRARKLIDELVPMVVSGEVRREQRTHRVSIDAWRVAIEQMVSQRDQLRLPLKSHGYLLSVAPKVASAAEAAGEDLRRIASSQREGTESRISIELAVEENARKRFGQPAMTSAEREAFKSKLRNQP